jgi:hypothetical protein
MTTKKIFFGLGSFSIKDGLEIRFWEDIWLGNATLREQYPALYSIVHQKAILSPKFWRHLLHLWRLGGICLGKDL